MTTITQALRRAIQASSLTQYALSQESGVSASQISRFVHGETSWDLRTADRLAGVLELELVSTNVRPRGDRIDQPSVGISRLVAPVPIAPPTTVD